MIKTKLLAASGALAASLVLGACGSASGGHDMGSMLLALDLERTKRVVHRGAGERSPQRR